MDIQTLLAVAGIAATVLLGVWAIIITVRYNRSVDITFALDQVIALTDDITQNFPDLTVQFRNQPVSDNLVLLKGYFINTGKKDISREMTEQQITLNVPVEFEWVECKVVKCSPSLKADAHIHGKAEIRLETGLWKVKEFFRFEALAKVPVVKVDPDNLPTDYPTRRLMRALTFSHRIADSKEIHETRIPRFTTGRTRRQVFGIPLLGMSSRASLVSAGVAALLGAALWAGGFFLPDKSIGYQITLDGQEHVLSVRVKHDKVRLSDTKGFKRELTLPEFDTLPDKHLVFVAKRDRFMTIFGGVYFFFGVFMFVTSATRGVRENRLLAIIAEKEKDKT